MNSKIMQRKKLNNQKPWHKFSHCTLRVLVSVCLRNLKHFIDAAVKFIIALLKNSKILENIMRQLQCMPQKCLPIKEDKILCPFVH